MNTRKILLLGTIGLLFCAGAIASASEPAKTQTIAIDRMIVDVDMECQGSAWNMEPQMGYAQMFSKDLALPFSGFTKGLLNLNGELHLVTDGADLKIGKIGAPYKWYSTVGPCSTPARAEVTIDPQTPVYADASKLEIACGSDGHVVVFGMNTKMFALDKNTQTAYVLGEMDVYSAAGVCRPGVAFLNWILSPLAWIFMPAG